MIESNYFLIVVFGLTVGTILIRGSFISLSGKMVISDKVKELFGYIPAAILPALIIPATFFHQGKVDWIGGHERFAVIIVALIVSYFVRNTLFIVSLGLALLYLVTIGS